MGRAPERPARSPSVNSGTPVPMLLIMPRPVTATRRRPGAGNSVVSRPMRRGGLPDRRDYVGRAPHVVHVRERALVDGDMESALQRGQDLDSLQRVGFELVPEMGSRADSLEVDLEDRRDDVPDLLAQVRVSLFGTHLILRSVDLACLVLP